MIFNDFSKVQVETLTHIYRGTPELSYRITKQPLHCEKHPGHNAIKAIGSPGGSGPRRRRDWRPAAAGLGRRKPPGAATYLVRVGGDLGRAGSGLAGRSVDG
jgi:hypothetical protein